MILPLKWTNQICCIRFFHYGAVSDLTDEKINITTSKFIVQNGPGPGVTRYTHLSQLCVFKCFFKLPGCEDV